MDMIEKADLLRKKANVTYAEAQAAPEKSAPTLLRLIGRLIRTLILFVRFTIFKVTRRGDTLITLPTALFLLLMFFFWRALLPVMLIALLFGVEYSFDGTKRTQGNK